MMEAVEEEAKDLTGKGNSCLKREDVQNRLVREVRSLFCT